MNIQEIVKQLEWCGYTCEAGPLENNVAFIELKEIAGKDQLIKDMSKDLIDLWEAVHKLQDQANAAHSHPERDQHMLRKQEPEE